MGLTILYAAYPFAPVREDTAGGAEQVLLTLDEAVVKNGDRSIVVAMEGSSVCGELVPTPSINENISWEEHNDLHTIHLKNINNALDKYDINLIHMHGIDFKQYLPITEIPVLITIHLPFEWYPQGSFDGLNNNIVFNSVSVTQQDTFPDIINSIGTIPNGIPVDKFIPKMKKDNYAVCLGRVCWDKGYHHALRASREAGIPLYIAGEVYNYEWHKQYFEEWISPLLDNKDYKFIGKVDIIKKRELLSSAVCLLIPSVVPETSSLVAMEAMASGTPVIAFPSGALPEIIEDGITGFLVNNEPEMTEAIKKIRSLDPAVCRQRALERFSSDKMVENYYNVYARLTGRYIQN
jgi:glycosyltransferase involved in cell wall biosynthesis